ncbi:jupiter microtubule associated homolog 1-like [Echinops telfairi]|uniref:Jupiter microtubule associated homolog 1-like n=1 Tax=Echinops telfairi TaxID=9371 RepID=A0ABM0ZT65_ECHTE|nr:jupiter microtubule associated homolog 1-like [Echinops telfairi]
MTTTTTFKGVDPNSRSSSRVLRPPGGGSNFSLGFDEPAEQPVRRNKMASNIFGTSEDSSPSWAKCTEFVFLLLILKYGFKLPWQYLCLQYFPLTQKV